MYFGKFCDYCDKYFVFFYFDVFVKGFDGVVGEDGYSLLGEDLVGVNFGVNYKDSSFGNFDFVF